MQIGTFRSNVIKTVSAKPVKLGMRTASKDKVRMIAARSAVCLKANTGQLIHGLSPYILGEAFNEEMKQAALQAMGDMSYDLTVLCRFLKVKMPTATKKIKLVGTRGAALLQLEALTTDLLAVAEQSIFSTPQMVKVKKMVTNPAKNGAKEERELEVVDDNAESAVEAQRQEKMKAILALIVDLFWRLSFDIFKQPPEGILDAKFQRMQAQYPGVEFTLQAEPEEEEAKEAVKA